LDMPWPNRNRRTFATPSALGLTSDTVSVP
jgi:hypothetical protein